MTGYSSRQSTYATGNVINADDSNDEFDALITAFGTSGHNHDGTAGNGGALSKLTGSNAITFGAATADTDITVMVKQTMVYCYGWKTKIISSSMTI